MSDEKRNWRASGRPADAETKWFGGTSHVSRQQAFRYALKYLPSAQDIWLTPVKRVEEGGGVWAPAGPSERVIPMFAVAENREQPKTASEPSEGLSTPPDNPIWWLITPGRDSDADDNRSWLGFGQSAYQAWKKTQCPLPFNYCNFQPLPSKPPAGMPAVPESMQGAFDEFAKQDPLCGGLDNPSRGPKRKFEPLDPDDFE